MKKTLSIEELCQKIANPKTRMAMDEVLSCLYSHNLRSAIVMLYSTVVSDLYYKLQDLKDLYGDRGATQILDEIENERLSNPKSSAWEIEMPQKCCNLNKIIRVEDLIHYESLQKERNLCAHPVIDGTDDLYRPNPAYVQGLIINMLEGLLCKPSFISKDLFNIFVDDIERTSQNLIDDKMTVKYIGNKYLDKIDNPQEEYLLFKSLWKIVFFLENERCNENRTINYKVLCRLMERHKEFMLSKIHSNQDIFFKDASIPTPTFLENVLSTRWGLLIQFLNDYPQIQNCIPSAFQLEMDKKINEKKELSCIALYNKVNMFEHIMECVKTEQYNLSYASILYLNNVVRNNFSVDNYSDFAITLYGSSPCFDNANWIFSNILKPLVQQLYMDKLTKLLSYMNGNDQIRGSYEFGNACRLVKERLSKLNPAFDYSQYPYIK